jgi:hypothetical protein
MNCSEVRPLLDLLCDGVLEAKDSALVLDHLKSCGECKDEWSDLEQLHASFQVAKTRPALPAGFMDRVAEKLKEEDRNEQKRFFSKCVRAMPVLAIAAAIALVGFFVLPGVDKLNHQGSSVKTASADTLVEDLIAEGTMEPVRDRVELTKRVGFDLKQVRLPEWHMEKSGVYKSQAKSPAPVSIARFDFVRKSQVGDQYLSCYQAPQGVIRTKVAESENIAGKQVVFGSHGKLQFALWSQNGRDYLFITALPKSQLQEIVRGA